MSRQCRARSMSSAVIALVVLLLLAAPAAASPGRPLAQLEGWGAKAGKLGARSADRGVQREIRRLRELVPRAARRFRADASRASQARELNRAERALAAHLEPLAARLPFRRRWFFLLAYQEQLERFARLAGLLRTPTGVPQPPARRQLTPREFQAATMADSDGDGRLDQLERDDDNDGVADARDAFDSGWGIPDGLHAREDFDRDADEDGTPDSARSRACVFATEAVPAPRTVGAAAAWLRRAERRRRCHVARGERAVAAEGTRPGRRTRLGRVRLEAARIEAGELQVRVRTRRAVALHFRLIHDGRLVGRSRALRVRKGDGLRRAKLRGARGHGLDVLEVVSAGARARLIAQVGPPAAPRPVAVAAAGLTRRLPGLSPGASTCPVPVYQDTDKDSVTDCTELAGFNFDYYLPGNSSPQTIPTASDPSNPNTDGDTVVQGSQTFSLSDGQEWQAYLAGGTSNPAVSDSDTDGLGDVQEFYLWGSTPNAIDSDSDSTGPEGTSVPNARLYDAGELQGNPQITSPTLADTDGDSFSDYAELLQMSTNPRVSQVPEFTVATSSTARGVEIAIPASATQQTIQSQFEDQQSGSNFTDQTTDTSFHQKSGDIEASVTGGCGVPPASGAACIPFGQATVSGGAQWTNSTTHTHQTTFSTQSQRESQQAYQQSTTVELKPQGTLSATFDVTNTGSVAMQIRNLGVLANAECLPASGSGGGPAGCLDVNQVTTVATLTPVNAPSGGIVLNPSETQTYQFSATVDTPVLQSLLANPGNLSFTPANYDLYTADGQTDYAALIGQSIDTNTGQVTIDFDNGDVENYMVATNVDRDWGSPTVPAGATAKEIFTDILAIPYETVSNPPPAPSQRQVLSQVRSVASQGQGPNGTLPDVWAVFGSAEGLDSQSTDFDDFTLLPTQTFRVAHVRDQDGDGLWDREERALGTSDLNQDTDGDQASGPNPKGGTYPSDYFESQVGWEVPFPSAEQEYQVYSSPVACDADDDGSPDGPGPGNESLLGICPSSSYSGEAARTTDPTDPDTNDNGIPDGSDPHPLQPPPQPVDSGQWTGQQLVATGGQATGDSAWLLNAAGQSIAAPTIALCASEGPGQNCGNASGYYQLTWSVGLLGSVPAGPAGQWTVTTQNPSDAAPVQWLSASLDPGEAQLGVQRAYELYFHIPGTTNMQNAQLEFEQLAAGGAQTVIAGLKLEPVTQAQYLAAAQSQTGTPDPDFAGIAFAGQDFGQDKGTTDDGPQGIRIDQPAQGAGDFEATAWGPPAGFDVPAGGYRAGFQMRIQNNDVDDSEVAGLNVSQGAGAPTNADPIQPSSGGFVAAGTSRYALASGHVWRRDFSAPGAAQVFNLVFDQLVGSQNLSFPIGVSPAAGGLSLDNVTLDVLPSPPGYLAGGRPYSGFGFSAHGRSGETALASDGASYTGAQFARLGFDSKDNGSAWTTGTFTSSSRWAQWLALVEAGPATKSGAPLCDENYVLFNYSGSAKADIHSARPPFTSPAYIATTPESVGTTAFEVVFPPSIFQLTCQKGVLPQYLTIMQAYLVNRPAAPGGVTIEQGARTVNRRRVRLTVQVPTGVASMTISNRRDFKDGRRMDARRRVRWTLARRGGRRRNVYVRFSNGKVVRDGVVLDRRAPRGKATARRLAGDRYRLRVLAFEALSGRVRMQLSLGGRRTRWLPLRRSITVRSRSPRIRIRFRDGAGNVSAWQRVTRARQSTP